jgi:hypothetical protein
MRRIPLVLSAFLMTYPALAQTGGADRFMHDVRSVADNTAGRRVGPNQDQLADKVVAIGRRADGTMIVTAIQALAPGGANDGIAVTDRAIAIMRTRAAAPNGNRAPDPDDFAYVRRTGMRLFVVGEWSTPAAMWEIERDAGGSLRLRTIGPDGAAGPWEAPAG